MMPTPMPFGMLSRILCDMYRPAIEQTIRDSRRLTGSLMTVPRVPREGPPEPRPAALRLRDFYLQGDEYDGASVLCRWCGEQWVVPFDEDRLSNAVEWAQQHVCFNPRDERKP